MGLYMRWMIHEILPFILFVFKIGFPLIRRFHVEFVPIVGLTVFHDAQDHAPHNLPLVAKKTATVADLNGCWIGINSHVIMSWARWEIH